MILSAGFAVSASWFRPIAVSMAFVWLALPSLLALIEVSLATDHPVDFWLHVNTGRSIWQTASLAGRDQFTCTIAGSEVVNQNWLAELLTYGLYRAGGFELCQFMAGACYAAAIGLITRLSLLRSGDAQAAAIAGFAGLALAVSNFGIRPQAISTLLFAAELFVLCRGTPQRQTIAWTALIEVLWANVHGAFALGLILPGIFLVAAAGRQAWQAGWRTVWADGAVRMYFACTFVAGVAMFINPQPSQTLHYVFNTSSKSAARGIEEWLPTTFGTLTGTLFFVSIACLLGLIGLSRRRLEPVEVILLTTFLILGAQAQRMVIWFALIVPPIAAPLIAGLRAHRAARSLGDKEHAPWEHAPWPLLAMVFAVLLTTLPWTRSYNALLPAEKRSASGIHEPAGAVEFLRSRGYRGNLFAPVSWGAYLTCFLYPDVKVFNDSRIESFPDDVWSDYLQIGAGQEDWNAALGKYNIDAVVWSDRLSAELLASLESSPRWRQVFQDANCVIFLRSDLIGPSSAQVAR